MGKGLLFFCCACCILALTIVNLSIGPIISGAAFRFLYDPDDVAGLGTLNCKAIKDALDLAKDAPNHDDDLIKYGIEYQYNKCTRAKGMHDMEYTAFIFDIVIGFVCGLIGLLHLFDLKKDFVANTGIIGLACGIVGFVLTFVYVIFNGLVYTTVYVEGIYKRDGDYAYAEKDGNNFKCFYFDHEKNGNSKYAKISDLGKKQYNYKKDWSKDIAHPDECITNNLTPLCTTKEIIENAATIYPNCDYLYIDDLQDEITNKDISDRFVTTLILSLIVCLANIGLALFGFLLFRDPSGF
jgi:hypothetical protein